MLLISFSIREGVGERGILGNSAGKGSHKIDNIMQQHCLFSYISIVPSIKDVLMKVYITNYRLYL